MRLAMILALLVGCHGGHVPNKGVGDATRSACAYRLTVDGAFTATARWDVNNINGPATNQPPPDLAIADDTLAVLNQRGAGTLRETLGRRGTVCDANASDDALLVAVRIGGDNDLGGHYGGLDLRLTITSPSQPADIVTGGATVGVEPGAADAILDHLGRAFDAALDQALSDYQAHLDAAASKPILKLHLVVDVSGLSAEQAKAADGLVPCLLDRGATLSSTPAGDHAWDVDYRLDRWGTGQTEPEYLAWFAGQIESAAINHGKGRCSLWKTPLEGLTTVAAADTAARTVTVRWDR